MDPSTADQAPLVSLSSAPPTPSQAYAFSPPLPASELLPEGSTSRPRALSLLDEPEDEEALAPTSTLPPSASSRSPLANGEFDGSRDRLKESLDQLKKEPAFLVGGTRTERSGSLYGQGRNPGLGLDVPDEEERVEGEAQVYVPGLTSATLFVLLPMVRSRRRVCRGRRQLMRCSSEFRRIA